MTTGLSMVIRLKYFKSEEICHGIPPALPISLLQSIAITIECRMRVELTNRVCGENTIDSPSDTASVICHTANEFQPVRSDRGREQG